MADWMPLYDKIIVRRDAAPEIIGAMVVPDAHKKDQNAGTVLRVGIGRLDPGTSRVTTLLVGVGFRVLFGQFSGIALDPDAPDVIVLREDELLAYQEPEWPVEAKP
jgi:co-chaperonin GroES (HSP10)